MKQINLLTTTEPVFEQVNPNQDILERLQYSFRIDIRLASQIIIASRPENIKGLFLRKDNFSITHRLCAPARRNIPLVEILFDNPKEVYNEIEEYVELIGSGLYFYLGKPNTCDSLSELLLRNNYKTKTINLDL